jgi:GNAT superfamily N-acetyltransferase
MDTRPLSESDRRENFSSGNSDIDRFFRHYAGQNQFRLHVGTTYVALDAADVIGYVTLSAASVEIEDLPEAARKRLPRYPAPVLRLSRMGVVLARQKEGVGRALLNCAFGRALDLMRSFGCVGVVVDAKPGVENFYARYGFVPLTVKAGVLLAPDRPTPMFLGIKAVPGYSGA